MSPLKRQRGVNSEQDCVSVLEGGGAGDLKSGELEVGELDHQKRVPPSESPVDNLSCLTHMEVTVSRIVWLTIQSHLRPMLSAQPLPSMAAFITARPQPASYFGIFLRLGLLDCRRIPT